MPNLLVESVRLHHLPGRCGDPLNPSIATSTLGTIRTGSCVACDDEPMDELEAIAVDAPLVLEGGAGPRSAPNVPLLLDLVRTIAIVVAAAALVLIAADTRRQTVILDRSDCRQRASNFREDRGAFPPDYNRLVEEACGSRDPLTTER